MKPGRSYYPLSTHDNAHNLPASYIREQEEAHPPGTPIHSTLILGKRGATIVGDPVYGTPADGSRGGAFLRSRHEGPCAYDKRLRLEVGLDFGKHHPCVVMRQVSPVGQCGGISAGFSAMTCTWTRSSPKCCGISTAGSRSRWIRSGVVTRRA